MFQLHNLREKGTIEIHTSITTTISYTCGSINVQSKIRIVTMCSCTIWKRIKKTYKEMKIHKIIHKNTNTFTDAKDKNRVIQSSIFNIDWSYIHRCL